jgi:hypothetical protein
VDRHADADDAGAEDEGIGGVHPTKEVVPAKAGTQSREL